MFDSLIYNIISKYVPAEFLYVSNSFREHAIIALKECDNVSSDGGHTKYVVKNDRGLAVSKKHLIDYSTGELYHYRMGMDDEYFIMKKCNEKIKVDNVSPRNNWWTSPIKDIEMLDKLVKDKCYKIYNIYSFGGYIKILYTSRELPGFIRYSNMTFAVNDVYYEYDKVYTLVIDAGNSKVYKLHCVELYEDLQTIMAEKKRSVAYYFCDHKDDMIMVTVYDENICLKHIQTVSDLCKK